jgi:hypothetical protein
MDASIPSLCIAYNAYIELQLSCTNQEKLCSKGKTTTKRTYALDHCLLQSNETENIYNVRQGRFIIQLYYSAVKRALAAHHLLFIFIFFMIKGRPPRQ